MWCFIPRILYNVTGGAHRVRGRTLWSLGNISAGKRFLFLSLVGTVSLEEDAGAHQPDPQESAVSDLC